MILGPRRFASTAVALALLPGAGCSDFLNKFTADSSANVFKIAVRSTESEADPQLARDALPGTVKTVDGFLEASPENPNLLELVAQSYSQYAFGFLEDDLEAMAPADTPQRQALIDRCTGLYDRAVGMGLRYVALSDPDFPKKWKADQATFAAALNDLRPPASPGLYWAALSFGSAINLHRDDMDRVADLPKAIAALERVHQLNAEYFHHGAALALGVVYASQGKAMGGNPEKAKLYFEEVIDATGGRYLMAKTLFARYYATVTQDRPLFEKTLKEVLEAKPDLWPEQRLANELAKKRAARYLKQVEDLF